jgi:HEAT repeat protein
MTTHPRPPLRPPLPSLLAGVLAGALALTGLVTNAHEESALLRILQSEADCAAKCEALKQLRLVATPNAINTIAPFLIEESTAHAARHALEPLPFPEANAALRQALTMTSGNVRVGLIDSLGWRQDPAAVPLLAPLLSDSDPATATATAIALGQIANAQAIAALKDASAHAPPSVRPAIVDGLLRCAERLLADNQPASAAGIYQSLHLPSEQPHVRTAAYAGLIRSSSNRELALVLAALQGEDHAAQTAALQLATQLSQPQATAALAGLLAKTSPALQPALIALLQARADPVALGSVVEASRSPERQVRTAALTALGTLGDASTIPLLATTATSQTATDQTAARHALATLHRGDITAALVAHLPTSSPAAQIEIARALSSRADPSAVPALLQLARNTEPGTRRAATQALGTLVDAAHLEALLCLALDTPDESTRTELYSVFEALLDRTPDPSSLEVGPLVQALAHDDPAIRAAALPIAALVPAEPVRASLRAALHDSQPAVRSIAARALATSKDPAMLPDLFNLIQQLSDPTLRSLALQSAVRIASEHGSHLNTPERAEALAKAFSLATKPQEKRMALSAVARVPHPLCFDLARKSLVDPEVTAEAELAALELARQLGAQAFDQIQPTLAQIAARASSTAVQSQARALLQQLDSRWLYAGPYRQTGKVAQELFDIPFPPETTDPIPVSWQRAPGSTDLTRTGEVDLGNIVGGDHCVVYLKTRIHAPTAQAATFHIGSDDGIKLWLNGQLVHANNAVRGLTPGQDRAQGELRSGWNDLLAKITQHTLGCGLHLRITTPNDAEIPGLTMDPHD